jgi:hypothetical protein
MTANMQQIVSQRRPSAAGLSIDSMSSRLLQPAVDSDAPVITGTVRVRKLRFVVIDQDEYLTTSMDFVPLPSVVVDFKLGGRKPSNVVATFSAMSFAAGLDAVVVRVRLDDGTVAVPAEAQFSGAVDPSVKDFGAESHAYQFVFPQVPPGSHTVAVDFRSVQGLMVFIHRPSLVVAYR